MRVAVSGAHRTGKTTLVEALHRLLPSYAIIEEPYHQLESEGYVFAEMPSLEDFEAQLERSLECAAEPGADNIFDRCPADFVAYLLTHRDARDFDIESWLPRVAEAMAGLDLIVYVPIENPDRMMPSEKDPLRRRVAHELREILHDDRWDFGLEVIEVVGTPEERARQVLARVTSSTV